MATKDETVAGGTATERNERQYRTKPHNGSPCPICGKTVNAEGQAFASVHQFAMHINWHVRRGEARVNAAGETVPTAAGRVRFRDYLENYIEPEENLPIVTPNEDSQGRMGQIAEHQTVQIPVTEDTKSVEAIKLLQQTAAMMQFALILQDMPPEAAMHMMTTIKQVGSMQVRRR